MPASYPGGPVIGVVGEGFGSLLVHCTARRLGLENREIAILGTGDDPIAINQQYVHNLDHMVLRSEFESLFRAPDRPRFALLDAYSHKSPKPLWRTRSELVGGHPRSDRPGAVLSSTPGAVRVG